MMTRKVINTPPNKYTRWTLLRLPWFSIYIHKIIESDTYIHNHPWNFISIVLKGRCTYLNILSHHPRKFSIDKRRLLSIKKYKSNDYHCIKVNKPVYMLYIAGRKINNPEILELKKRH